MGQYFIFRAPYQIGVGFPDVYGWLFVPNYRKAVADAMSWTVAKAFDGIVMYGTCTKPDGKTL